jgi:hypothetical protein
VSSGVAWTIRNPEQLGHLYDYLKKQPCPYNVKLSAPTPPRTNQQLNYVHSLINAVALYSGVSMEQAKKDCKVAAGVVHVSRNCLSGERSARLLSLADYKKADLSNLISHLEVWLAEHSVEYVPSE